MWGFRNNRMAVRFAYEWHDDCRQLVSQLRKRDCGSSTKNGLMQRREASINDLAIDESERKFRWEGARRPDDYPGLTELGL